LRLLAVLDRWRSKLVQDTLQSRSLPAGTMQPFVMREQDVASPSGRNSALWSKILPFVLVVWALTGAFYPAVDLCAGEKERGTLETLLCSPAERKEIVWGKLLTVSVFSIATSMLNLISLTMTGALVVSRIQLPGPMAAAVSMGAPPLMAIVWLFVALLPLSALFSALALGGNQFGHRPGARDGRDDVAPYITRRRLCFGAQVLSSCGRCDGLRLSACDSLGRPSVQ
jgi:sodium transport system permease protein